MNNKARQEAQKSIKHFLDTPVLRPVLLGTHTYRQYFERQFNDERQYISDYVLMEFRRSYLCNIIKFYFMLDMPFIKTVGDALKGWSHKFKSSELKAVQQFVGDISNIFILELLLNNVKCPKISPFAVSLSNRLQHPSTSSGRTVTPLIKQQLY